MPARSYSNFGKCLDLFAPGDGITSAWNTSDSASNTISGTSMASPHVAGVAARYLEANPGATPASVATALTQSATANVVTGAGSLSANLLVWADPGAVTLPPPPPPAKITLSGKGTKNKGVNTASLTWSGATTAPVTLYRNDVAIVVVDKAGSYNDTIGKGSGTYSYKVCQPDVCSNTVTVSF